MPACSPLTPGDGALTAAGWVWPPAALVLAVWMVRAARRATTGRARWLLYPVIGALAVTAVGGTVESVALARDQGRYPMPGALYDVGGHRLHLNCTGTGSPTVVLENGLNEISPLWSGITAQVVPHHPGLRVRPGRQGWSDDAAGPQDGLAVAADLHTLLARAGERGPYVLAGHSSGGTHAMTYAARYPAQVAGMVLLDSSSPHQFTDLPDFPGTYAMMRRLLPVMPALARVGALHLVPAVRRRPPCPRAPQRRSGRSRPAPAAPATCATSRPSCLNVFTPGAGADHASTRSRSPSSPPGRTPTARRAGPPPRTGWPRCPPTAPTGSPTPPTSASSTTRTASTDSVRAITAVVTAVRTGTPLATR